jgi:hypothetical protein
MTYYSFTEACATKETGPVSPQVYKWKPRYDDDKVDSYYSFYNASERGKIFPDFAPNMDAMIMHGRAKPTDLVSVPLSIGFMVSEKLKTLFEQFNFPPHRFYPTKIIHKKVDLGSYYYMHLVSKYYDDYLNDVDYSKSVFVITGIGRSNPQSITLTSKKDYLEQSELLQQEALTKKAFRGIDADKIHFNANFDIRLDCFRAPFGIQYYISQRLRDAIVAEKITGCDIELTDVIKF